MNEEMMEKQKNFIAKGVVKGIDSIVNTAVLVIFLLLFVYGIYGMWDSNQIYQAASTAKFEIYKPSTEDSLSFEELQAMNPEVFGWLTVYGTGIDYPLVQGESNEKYLNTDASGEYSLSGSLFLDYRNQKDFTDFNNMIFGHHMEKGKMFGDVEKFLQKDYFDSHRYGNLYYKSKNHGVEFFAILQVNAYDQDVYKTAIDEIENRKAYLDTLYQKAACSREIQIQAEDHIVLLSTCASDTTDGRHILVGKITDETYPDSFMKEEGERNRGEGIGKSGILTFLRSVPVWIWAVIIVFLILIIILVTQKMKGRNNTRKEGITDEKSNK